VPRGSEVNKESEAKLEDQDNPDHKDNKARGGHQDLLVRVVKMVHLVLRDYLD